MSAIVTNLKDLSDGIKEMIPGDDNVKLNMTDAEQRIQIMKLSLQIEACIHSGRIANYLKTSKFTFPLPYDLAECDPEHKCLQKNVSILFGTIDESNVYYLKPDYSSLKMIQYGYEYYSPNGISVGYGYLPTDVQESYFAKYPLFELFKKISPYNTLASASHFFGISNRTFDPVEKGLYHIEPTIFLNTTDNKDLEDIKGKNPDFTGALVVEYAVSKIISRKEYRHCLEQYSNVFEADLKQVYDFQTTSGLTVMKMLKKYNYTPTGTSKAYIPLTKWMFHGEPDDRLFTVPLRGKQPLYNLQYFQGSEYVVICPNIEIADKMQRSNPFENVVFTSFVCNHGYYNQVDFSELEGKKAVLLIVNHSGMEIEDAVVESKGFYEYLKEQEKKIKYTELSVIQTAVKYNLSGKDFYTMEEYIEQYQKAISVAKSTFIFTSEEEYDANYTAAAERIRMRSQEIKPYWMQDTVNETEDGEAKKESHSEPMQLMRGIIARGNLTYIIGQSGIGKSNITASLCAYLVNTSERAPRPFAERFWTRCKIQSEYERVKIVYLDFDNNEGIIKNREEHFVNPYMPDDHKERVACKENYIVEPMLGDPVNYSVEENFDEFCNKLDNIAENKGVKGQPIDILVIDTYWAFTHGNDTKFNVFRKLLAKYPDMAIVVQHHLNEDGKAYGRQDKTFEADTTIHLWRDKDNGSGETLKTPFNIQITGKHRLIHCEEELKPFQAKLDENNHFVIVNPKHDKTEMLKILVKEYKELTKKELAGLLGMSVNTLSDKLK